MHSLFAHLALLLTLTGAGIDLVGALSGRRTYRRWAGWLLIGGAAAVFLTFFSGSGTAAPGALRPQEAIARLEAHSLAGSLGTWLLLGGGLLRAMWRERLEGVHGWAMLAMALLSAALVSLVAALGYGVARGI